MDNNIVDLVALFRAPLIWCVIVLCVGGGLLGLASPQFLKELSASSKRSVAQNRFFPFLDKSYDTDSFLLRHARLFGLCALATAIVLIYQIA